MAQQSSIPSQNSSSGGNKRPSRSQRRALEVLSKIKAQAEQFTPDDVAFLKGLPSMIMQNGLGQAIAFMVVKTKDKENERRSGGQSKKNYAMINRILCELVGLGNDPVKALENIVQTTDLSKYRRYQQEAIEYAAWMKKFAIAFAKEEPKKKGS
ncbi:MAG: type III-B CRISPR module-associated protein Cmr5 [Archaeoglobales archaeon]|nr:type III-B CRISPR module-associated protein Cmr5 [Archaeoglobales archaeon]